MTGTIVGGWEFVIAGYAVTAVVLILYTISLLLRSRSVRESSRRPEPADD